MILFLSPRGTGVYRFRGTKGASFCISSFFLCSHLYSSSVSFGLGALLILFKSASSSIFSPSFSRLPTTGVCLSNLDLFLKNLQKILISSYILVVWASWWLIRASLSPLLVFFKSFLFCTIFPMLLVDSK